MFDLVNGQVSVRAFEHGVRMWCCKTSQLTTSGCNINTVYRKQCCCCSQTVRCNRIWVRKKLNLASLFLRLELGNSMAVDRKQVLASVSLSIAKLIISLFLSRTIHKQISTELPSCVNKALSSSEPSELYHAGFSCPTLSALDIFCIWHWQSQAVLHKRNRRFYLSTRR